MNKNILKGAGLIAAASLFSPLAMADGHEEGPSWGISGWINEGMTYWDDGTSSDVTQMSENGTTLGSRITLSGSTPLAGTGLNAGFEVILEPLSNQTPLIFANQAGIGNGTPNVDTFGDSIGVLGSSLHVGGAWGKLTFGLQSMPTDNIAVLADPSLTLWDGIFPVFRGNGFAIQGLNGATAVWGDFLSCYASNELTGAGGIGGDCNGIYRNGVRYDLPAFGPVSVAVGYANDDIFDVSVKYSGNIAGLVANVHGGYAYNANGGALVGATDGADHFQIQAGLMDPGTGIFGFIAYQNESADGVAAGVNDDTSVYWGKFGIKKNWVGYGDTAISFDYGQYEDQFSIARDLAGVTGSEVQRWGLAVDQYFGSNLIIYGKYENLSLDVDGGAAVQAAYGGSEDLDTFTLGLTYFF